MYQPRHEPLTSQQIRNARDNLRDVDQIIIDQTAKGLISQIKDMKTGNRNFGIASAHELLAKLGMILLAKDNNIYPDLRRRSTMSALLDLSDEEE